MQAAHSLKDPIHGVEGLRAALLRGGPEAHPAKVLARTRIPLDRLSGRLSWGKRKYERVCLAREKDFEVLLIGYRPGQGTSIHDYDSAEAWVMPVSGELQEERFDLDPAGRPSPVTTRIIGPWTISYLPQERSVHRFTNVGPDPCMTLNIYAGPVKRWRVYSGYGPAWMPVGS